MKWIKLCNLPPRWNRIVYLFFLLSTIFLQAIISMISPPPLSNCILILPSKHNVPTGDHLDDLPPPPALMAGVGKRSIDAVEFEKCLADDSIQARCLPMDLDTHCPWFAIERTTVIRRHRIRRTCTSIINDNGYSVRQIALSPARRNASSAEFSRSRLTCWRTGTGIALRHT